MICACKITSKLGGIAGKLRGRVGDAPLVGCGGYANEHGAATVTGHGETVMKMTLAREVVYMMENGKSAQVRLRMIQFALNNLKSSTYLVVILYILLNNFAFAHTRVI